MRPTGNMTFNVVHQKTSQEKKKKVQGKPNEKKKKKENNPSVAIRILRCRLSPFGNLLSIHTAFYCTCAQRVPLVTRFTLNYLAW